MSVYVDCLRDWGWKYGHSCHLIGDTIEELHAFAALLGLRRGWFQAQARHPHYDLTARKRAQAVLLGAVELADRPLALKLRQKREGGEG